MADHESNHEEEEEEDEDDVTLAKTWTPLDFKDNAKLWFQMTDALTAEQKAFKELRKAREQRHRELKKNIMQYMFDNGTQLNYKNKTFSVEEIESSNPINRKKMPDAIENFYTSKGQPSANAAAIAQELTRHVSDFMGVKRTLKLRQEISEEEKIRVKKQKADATKAKRQKLAEAKRRVNDAKERGLPVSEEDIALIANS